LQDVWTHPVGGRSHLIAAHPTRILVIRLGALGDFVLSFAPFAAIRAHHPGAEITLLTTSPFAALARAAPWFDRVVVDARPAWWNLPGVLSLARRLRGFDRVYDLQTSTRSSRYFRLAGRPAWSGIAAGCALPHANPARDSLHTLERQREQLAMAGITGFPPPDLSWLAGTIAPPPAPFALLVPGAAPHRPRKRWPAARFAELAAMLHARGLTPVVLGTSAETPLAATVLAACPAALDLTGRTNLPDIASLARAAALAVGNDTGPMHLAAAVGCACVVLFSADSDPALTAPRGPGGAWPAVLRSPDLSDLSVARVAGALP
jgi:ADP-heptose:LPS heptosyltransferase